MVSTRVFLQNSLIICFLATTNIHCKKYLDTPSDARLVIPHKVADVQALLDKYTIMAFADASSPEISSDNYYLSNADWTSMTQEAHRRMYKWEPDELYSPQSNEWASLYKAVYYSNVCLEALNAMDKGKVDELSWDNARGQALFFRAKSFLQAVIIWGKVYDKATASMDLGVPLRLKADFNETSQRASVADSYDRVIGDLKESIAYLPVIPLHVVRPSRPAAMGLLARAYLAMGEYDSCLKYADLCLQAKNTLVFYHTLNANANFPFSAIPSQQNPEIIYHGVMGTPQPLTQARCKIDSVLYRSYHANDLRKVVFFKNNGNGSYAFKGSYDGTSLLATSITTAEAYLMRAEANAWKNNLVAAMQDLNTLMEKRWKQGMFTTITAVDKTDALGKIREERRKELLMRGLRWMDIKRLNREGVNIILKRFLNGITYVLPPNDLRFALPIPEDVIALSGMQQNPR
ncbi:MAG: RagB/SusD family nutrient uptake outer membrane protein [Chitinophagaceae bacterium]|nr:RagB/SusD family nutrient uptake outer membrane protein [Chitinophagaceae bacterium]